MLIFTKTEKKYLFSIYLYSKRHKPVVTLNLGCILRSNV